MDMIKVKKHDVYTYIVYLSEDEARNIVHSLGKTMCRGKALDVSIELEDMLWASITEKIPTENE